MKKTLKDIKALLSRIIDEDPDCRTFAEEWNAAAFLDELEESITEEETADDPFEGLLPVTDADIMGYVLDNLTLLLDENFEDLPAKEVIDVQSLLHLLECHKYNVKHEMEDWDFPEDIKEEFIDLYDEIAASGEGKEPALSLFVRFTEELAEEENETALYVLGYHSYGGTKAFPCDWEKSRECISKLFERTGEPMYANTLGYIAYYGRCSDGTPDYDEAFRYFSYGAARGMIESAYKLADMYAGGKGIWKDDEAAFRIINDLYMKLVRRFCAGELTGKFADVALRMGRLYENGFMDEDPNPRAAYFYYLQARYAIRFRRELADEYGDDKVEQNIEDAVARVEDEIEHSDRASYRRENPWILQMALAMDQHVLVTFKELAGGRVKLVLDRLEDEESELHDFLITIPEHGYCAMQEHVTLYADRTKELFLSDPGDPVLVTGVEYDEHTGTWIFLQGYELVASFIAPSFEMKLPKK